MQTKCDTGGAPPPVLENLKALLGEERVLEGAIMSEYTSFRIGGPADLLLCPADEYGLISCIRLLEAQSVPWFILGNGTNLLVRDGGFRGAVVHLGQDFSYYEQEGVQLVCGAGRLLSAAASDAMRHGLSGLEFASGIPGSVGGALCMNAGAYGGEISDAVLSARVYDVVNNKIIELSNAEMCFSYRKSIFQRGGCVVLSVRFALENGDPLEIEAAMTDFKRRRNESQPVSIPSAGSFFKRPKGGFAARLIDDAGLKGSSVGMAQVSDKHAGFIINNGGASAAEVLELMELVISEVKAASGIVLEPEPEIIGE
jgi:UDP-N-acetylmuramate dehydrogenase